MEDSKVYFKTSQNIVNSLWLSTILQKLIILHSTMGFSQQTKTILSLNLASDFSLNISDSS